MANDPLKPDEPGHPVPRDGEAGESLRRSEERFRLIVERSPVGVAISDREGRIHYLNAKFTELFGYTREDLPTVDHWWPLAYPDPTYRAEMIASWDRIVAEAQAAGTDQEPFFGRVTCKDGTVRSVRINASELQEDQVVLFDDISLQMESAVRLQESEERLRSILEHSSNAFYRHDAQHRLTYFSPQVEAVLGYTPEEAMVVWTELATDHPINEVGFELTQRAIDTGEPQPPYELELRHQSGERVWVEVREAPVVEGGRTVAIVGALVDITRRREVEGQRSALQQQLLQSQKMEAVGRLAGGIAHDFNNLLTGILGNADLAQANLEPASPLGPLLGEITLAAERAAGLTRQLLAFSRKQLIEPRVVELGGLLRNLETLLGRLIGEDIDLEWQRHASPLYVRVDPGQIEQVVVNLAVNARDSMPGGGRLIIATTPHQQEAAGAFQRQGLRAGRYATIAVRDTGHGMDAETRARIFEPFFTTKAAGLGTGLGLATAFGIVSQHGGVLTVESQVGQGSTFTCFLPLWEQEVAPLEEVRPSPELPAGSGTVLVVEDEELVRHIAVRILERQGYAVLAAASGPEALALAATHPGHIDLLFTDVVMPGMNGRQLADRLSAVRPGLRVLYASGYTEDAIARHGVLEEGVEFVAKPYSVASLARRVAEVLRG